MSKKYGKFLYEYVYRDFEKEIEQYLIDLQRYYCPEEENIYIKENIYDKNGYLIPKRYWGYDIECSPDDMEPDE
ncbi:MAG: hypothetical protein IJR13_04315 [Bacteroidales bacterium]|nr:hypothetical protein [Bacteroidales bacterium]